MRIVAGLPLWALAAVFATPSSAEEAPMTPLVAKRVQVISVGEAADLVGKARFFDPRPPFVFGRGHIKGATCIRYLQKSERTASFDATKDHLDMSPLPRDKSMPIVFYSEGPGGWSSYKSAIIAARAGYSNVKWMRDGVSGWIAKGGALE